MTSTMFPRRLAAFLGWAGVTLACAALILAGCQNDPSSPSSANDPTALDPGGLFGREAPADCWVRYVAFERPDRPTWGLLIRRDGEAMASRRGDGPSGRVVLSAESLEVVRSWFADARFRGLEDEYLSDPPADGRRFEVFLRDGGAEKRVRAEADLMPRSLRLLVGKLQGLTERICANGPGGRDSSGVYGELSIDPAEAAPGTLRAIHFAFVNRTDDTLRLVFPSAQLYDFLLVLPPYAPGPGDQGGNPSDSTEIPPTHPGGAVNPPAVIWNWAYGQIFPDVMTEIVLAPGEVKSWEESWNGLSNEGLMVGPGVYALLARIPSNLPVPVDPIRVLVQRDHPGERPLAATLLCRPLEGPPETARTLTLSVTNLANDSVTVHFPSTQRYDFVLSHGMGMGPGDDAMHDSTGGHNPPPDGPRPVWRWAEGRSFDPVEGIEIWAPGETRTFTAEWDGRDLDGEPAGPGGYTLSAFLTGTPGVRSLPLSLVVLRR
jgi:hypothetical protein